MKKYNLYLFTSIILLVLITSSSSFAQDLEAMKVEGLFKAKEAETFDIFINLIDLTNNQPLKNIVITYSIDGTSKSEYFAEGTLNLELEQGSYEVEIEVEDKATLATDYFSMFNLDVVEDGTTSVYMYPVGFVRGFVKDKLDNIVPDADIKFECISEVITNYPKKTDKFGFFKVEHAPVGSCKVLGSYKDAIGIAEVEITK